MVGLGALAIDLHPEMDFLSILVEVGLSSLEEVRLSNQEGEDQSILGADLRSFLEEVQQRS